MRMNLERKGAEQNINFWFGSAIHFAMEDFFGYNKFGNLTRAFQAYYAAFKTEDRPNGADEHYYLGLGMLEYFEQWYPKHNLDYGFQTVWLDENKQMVPPGTEGAHPLIEESFILDLGIKVWVDLETGDIVKDALVQPEYPEEYEDPEMAYHFLPDGTKALKGTYVRKEEEGVVWEKPKAKFKAAIQIPVCYHGTLDRVVVDKRGRWWIMDWKTAKSADTNKLDTDDQISAYMWAAEQWFGHPIHGFVYVQLTKETPKPPKRLASGEFSVDKKQKTTHQLLRQELIKEYGEVNKAPKKLLDFLAHLAQQESPEGDRFIRWDLVTRTKEQKISTYHHILAEVKMMIDPELYLFPNPTRDCIWDCPFRDACLMMDNGQTQEALQMLDLEFEPRNHTQDGNIDPWREDIPWPEKYGEAVTTMIDNSIPEPDVVLNIILPEKYK